jgi:hypothetical protein
MQVYIFSKSFFTDPEKHQAMIIYDKIKLKITNLNIDEQAKIKQDKIFIDSTLNFKESDIYESNNIFGNGVTVFPKFKLKDGTYRDVVFIVTSTPLTELEIQEIKLIIKDL